MRDTMTSNDVIITVVIPTFNRSALLGIVLDGLEAQRGCDAFNIIVCDSDSRDDTLNVISNVSVGYPINSIQYVSTINNLSSKRNLGWKLSSTKYIVFLDDDCVPHANFISTYQDVFLSNPNPLRLYCSEVRFPKEWCERSNYYQYRDSRHFGSGRRNDIDPERLTETSIVTMCMGFEKDAIAAQVGYFDESFVGYGAEDTEFGARAVAAKVRILALPTKIVHHEKSASISEFGSKILRGARDGMKRLLEVHPQAVWAWKGSILLEPNAPVNAPVRLAGRVARAVLRSPLLIIVEKYLIVTDRHRCLYSKFLFKLIIARYYAIGVAARANSLTAEEAQRGWSRI